MQQKLRLMDGKVTVNTLFALHQICKQKGRSSDRLVEQFLRFKGFAGDQESLKVACDKPEVNEAVLSRHLQNMFEVLEEIKEFIPKMKTDLYTFRGIAIKTNANDLLSEIETSLETVNKMEKDIPEIELGQKRLRPLSDQLDVMLKKIEVLADRVEIVVEQERRDIELEAVHQRAIQRDKEGIFDDYGHRVMRPAEYDFCGRPTRWRW
ncbi:MAG: hypothetical protein AABX38_04775 [Candidatus Micrarchaeota archaeon]